MKTINRRNFLKTSIGAVAMTALSRKNIIGANEKVILGIMGVGGRGTDLVRHFTKRQDIKMKYICDTDSRRFGTAAEVVVKAHGYKPEYLQDFRKMLADPEIDAVINATPQHWHGLGTIMACQAGKDVYVEKPGTSSIWEGRKMIEAARKYKRVVQVGTQTSSVPYFFDALDYIRSGKLGDIHIVHVYCMVGPDNPSPTPARRAPQPKAQASESIPAEFDYELWCGPAKKLPYSSNFKGALRGWDWGSGAMTGDGSHQITLARVLIGKPYPDTVHHAGGVFNSDGELPDTQLVTYEYGKLTLIIEAATWTPYMKKMPLPIRALDVFPEWPFYSMKIEVLGTKGFMYLGRHGAGWEVYESGGPSNERDKEAPKSKQVAFKHGPEGNDAHIENFISCIRSRKRPNTDIEEGHLATMLCHLSGIGFGTFLDSFPSKNFPPRKAFSNSASDGSLNPHQFKKASAS